MVNMLVKCEAKSNRVKGMAFHPSLPWVLSALHNGTIQLWDYQLGALLDKFEDHEGPVRGMCFHPNQPLFVSGGDDYKVKVWDYKLRRCLFTLSGHLDYIRTCVFHPGYPWILSASDDQTIRIWNWQSRQCIAVLTGHNHYVMSAQFHPKDDLVISASLDQTIRVWDVSGLKEKTVANRPSMGGPSSDLFGVNDAVVKFVLEGHDRGVNWAEFHPTQPLIVSASDDRTVRLWRMSESKAWEIDSLRGHFNNVSAVTFHPKLDLIISDGEDKTIRVWDATKRTLLHTFKREHDRFWVICCKSNLIGVGHDTGMVVFKLDRERPLCGASASGGVHIAKDRMLASWESETDAFTPIGACRKQVSAMSSGYRSLVENPFNSTEINVLITYEYDGGSYDLFVAPNHAAAAQIEPKKGIASSVAFIARNRFAVLPKERSSFIAIYSLHNELSKKVDVPEGMTVLKIFPGGVSNRLVLLTSDEKLVLFDVNSRDVLGTLSGTARQIVWSKSGEYLAVLQKHSVVIASGSDLKQIQTVAETIRVKSGVWDEEAFIYATSSHLKYALPFPDESGLISTIAQPMYLLKVNKGVITYATREMQIVKAKIFTHEYLFKLALLRGDAPEVLHHLKTGRLLGSVTIGYLKKKGFPQVALFFVEDLQTRFNLSIEFGHLKEAFETAEKLANKSTWTILGTEAMRMGQIEIAEKCFIATHDVQGLQFLYFLAGNQAKLGKLANRASAVRDHQARFNLAILRGDAQERSAVLSELGLEALARKTLEMQPSVMPAIQVSHANWPTTRSMEEIFAAQWVGLEAAAAAAAKPPQQIDEEDIQEEQVPAAPVVDAKAWGDDELDLELEDVVLPVIVDVKKSAEILAYGESVEKNLLARRRLPVDLVAAGEFAEALMLLTKRVAIANPAPLEGVFTDVYLAAHANVPGLPFTPSISIPVWEQRVLFTPAFLQTKLDQVLVQTGAGNSAEALAAARYVLSALLLAVASNEAEEESLKKILTQARGYAQAMLIETTRREVGDKKRELELAAYVSCSREVETVHLLLIIGSAMNVAFRAKNYVLASHFAKRIITGAWGNDELVQATTMRARKVLTRSEQEGTDEIVVNFDPAWLTGSGLTFCCGSLAPVTDTVALCPYCQSSFGSAQWSGKTCTVCELSTVGSVVIGIQFRPV